jgi:putative ABC transport system permease protein
MAAEFYLNLRNRIASLPGVSRVAGITGLPLTGYNYTISVNQLDGRRAFTSSEDVKYVQVRVAAPGYFQTMGIPLIRGRLLEEQDRAGAPLSVVISESAARSLWPDGDAIGRTITLGTRLGLGANWARVGGTVVGIVGDVHEFGVREPKPPTLFASHAQFPVPDQTITVQSNSDPAQLIGPIRAELRELDAELPMSDVFTLEQIAGRSLGEERSYATLVGLYAVLALGLAAIGIYGVTTYSVVQRTREFGVRIALGASPSKILGGVLWRSLSLAGAGLILGGLGSLVLMRLLETMLFQLSPGDPVTLSAVAGALVVVTAAASWFPARRAKRVDPMTALREE